VARSARAADAGPALDQLAADFPDERVIQMLRGQLLSGGGRLDEALAAFDRALAIDDGTARAHAFAANLRILQGDYAGARKGFDASLARLPKGTAPGPQRYGTAFTYLYEGHPAKAIEVLRTYVQEYKNAGSPFGFPEVFIWNSIARIHLENGQLAEAMSAYEKGYASVPGSGLDETQKKIWLGRLHHGKGRTLARLGQHDAAWKEAQIIRKMIDEGGEQGKQFEPAWHYIAGYLKLEAGDVPAALEHLKQANPQDPFHKLLLARAHERAGDKAAAKRAYEEVAAFNQNTLERALSYPEAKKKLSTL
jgi:tetratricopeptide (TPR) repeat protein